MNNLDLDIAQPLCKNSEEFCPNITLLEEKVLFRTLKGSIRATYL